VWQRFPLLGFLQDDVGQQADKRSCLEGTGTTRSVIVIVILATAFPVLLAVSLAAAASDVMLVGASMTLDAIVEVPNAFLDMLATDILASECSWQP